MYHEQTIDVKQVEFLTRVIWMYKVPISFVQISFLLLICLLKTLSTGYKALYFQNNIELLLTYQNLHAVFVVEYARTIRS